MLQTNSEAFDGTIIRAVAAIIAPAFAAFCGAYLIKFTERRKLEVRLENLEKTILPEVRSVARAQEEFTLEVRRDMQTILEAEARALAQAEEEVKQQISKVEWDREWLQRERVQRYAEYLTACRRFNEAAIACNASLLCGVTYDRQDLSQIIASTFAVDVAGDFVAILAGSDLSAASCRIRQVQIEIVDAFRSNDGPRSTELINREFVNALRGLTAAMRKELAPVPIPG